MFSGPARGANLERFVASVCAFHPAGFRAMARSLAEADLRDDLAQVNVPTLLVWGDADTRSPLHQVADVLHAAIANSGLVVLGRVGHVSPVEAPELFTRAVRGFLRGVAARP
jgi:pimeloyl-ACP methyl ester carboxylesterase